MCEINRSVLKFNTLSDNPLRCNCFNFFSLKIIAHTNFLETLIKNNKNQISMIFFLLFAYPKDQYYKYFKNNLHPSANLFLLLLSFEFLTIIFRFIKSYSWIFSILYIWSQFLYLSFMVNIIHIKLKTCSI